MKPHVVYATNGFGGKEFLGGPSFSRMDALVALCASGARVTSLSTERPLWPDWAKSAAPQEPEWLVIPEALPLAPDLDRTLPRRATRWLRDAAAMRRFRRDIEGLNPDVLWVEDPMSHRVIEAYRSWDRVRRRVIMVRGSPDQLTGRYNAGPYQLDRALLEIASYTHLASVSSRVAEQWKAFSQLQDVEVLYLPNCAREELAAEVMKTSRAAMRERLGLPADRLIVTCTANIQFRKGQDLLVAAASELRRRIPHVLLLLVGNVLRGRGGEEIERRVREDGLGEFVKLVGHQPNPMDYVWASDVLAFPSREEAMPLTVLEGMVLGTPVVASDVSGIPELIEDGRDGLLFSHERPDELVAKLVRMCEDSAVRETFARAAREKYDRCFARVHQIARYRDAVGRLTA